MTKGNLVKVIKGKSAGAAGKVFWLGVTKFGKERVGIETPAGAVWATPSEVVADGPVPVVVLPSHEDLMARVAALEETVAELIDRLTAVAAVVNLLDERTEVPVEAATLQAVQQSLGIQ